VVNKICTYGYKYHYVRRLGLFASDEISLRNLLLTILVEGYIDLALSAFLGVICIYRSESNEEFWGWFGSLGDLINSLTSIILSVLVFIIPFFTRYIVKKYWDRLTDEDII